MSLDKLGLLDDIVQLIARICRPQPFSTNVAEICGRLAQIGSAHGLALFRVGAPGQLELIGAHGLPPHYLQRFLPHTQLPQNRMPGDVREALERARPVNVIGITEDPRTVSLSSVALEGRFASTLALPLIYDQRIVGLLHVFHTADLRSDRQHRLQQLSPLLSAALAASPAGSGEEDVENPERLERTLSQMHAAAERAQRTYAVVVYEIDRPDIVNQRCGADVLQRASLDLAQIIAGECRVADTAGRLDTRAYLACLPDASQEGAFAQCERVLDHFSGKSYKVANERIQLSASAGISCFPENGAQLANDSVRSARHALRVALAERGQRIVTIAARGSAAPAD